MNAPAMAANPARKAAQEFHFDCFERNSISSSGSATLNWGVPLRSLTVVPALLRNFTNADANQQ